MCDRDFANSVLTLSLRATRVQLNPCWKSSLVVFLEGYPLYARLNNPLITSGFVNWVTSFSFGNTNPQVRPPVTRRHSGLLDNKVEHLRPVEWSGVVTKKCVRVSKSGEEEQEASRNGTLINNTNQNQIAA